MDMQAAIEDHGELALIADNLEETREIMSQNRFSWAFLDLNLGKTSTLPIAEELSVAGTKICFVTGAEVPQDTLKRLDAKLLTKPIDMQHLLDLLSS